MLCFPERQVVYCVLGKCDVKLDHGMTKGLFYSHKEIASHRTGLEHIL